MNLIPYSSLPVEYKGMLERIESSLPIIRDGSEKFHKSASQFKMATLDITPLTPMRTMKQILAECERTRQALEEAHVRIQKNKVEIRRREYALSNGADVFDKELASIEITELTWQNTNIENAMKGAIRKLTYLAGQYQALLKSHPLTEEAYEKEESRYHVMTAFKQALCAARANGGRIDEGNHIYLFDLGINGEQAQREISAYFDAERKKPYTHKETLEWLERVADKFGSCPNDFAAARGLNTLDQKALT